MSKAALKFKELFLRELQFSQRLSDRTISAYKRDLSLYENFLKSSPKAVRRDNGFYRFLSRKGLSRRSQARTISALRSYFRFLQTRQLKEPEIPAKPELKPPSFRPGLPKALSFEEFQKLKTACKEADPARTLRNRLTLEILYGLGCRVSELSGLNLSDFNFPERWVKVTGKGQKQRLLPLSERLEGFLKEYLLRARPLLAKKTCKAFICNNRGNPTSRTDLWRWLNRWSAKAGFEETKNPHSFRHGCATALLEGGADLMSIRKVLGHRNAQTTQIYTSVAGKRLKETVRRFHPLSKTPPPG